MTLQRMKPLYLLSLLVLVLPVSLQWGCEGGPTTYRPPGLFTYRFEGALVKDLNINFTTIVATLTREDSILPNAMIRFGGDSLAFSQDSSFWRIVLPAGDYVAGDYDIEIQDSTLFHDTLSAMLADNFAINNVTPATRIKLTGDEVKLEWTGSAGSEGYVIAAVKRDAEYTGVGYSQYVTEQATAGIFPDSAFNKPTVNEPDTGWYYLYVYSYAGKPDSALSAELLPVPMPSQLGDNIEVRDLIGRFGTIVVTAFDSMHVVLLP
ncbi:MAG: hypothetical protein ACE5K8_06050 [Candidatus Zixiibacteriota bacterium]